MAKLSKKGEAFLDSLTTPEGVAVFKKETLDKLRKERPELTETQIDSLWQQAADQFGL